MKVAIQNSKEMYNEKNRTYIDVTQEFKEYKQTLIVKERICWLFYSKQI